MKVLGQLFLLFTVVSIVELYLLFRIAEITSWWVAVAMVLVPGMLGAWLAKREGARAFRAVVEAFATGHEPGGAILDGAMVLIASAFLITPGTLSDIAALLLLVPAVRRRVRGLVGARIRRAVERRIASGQVQVFGAGVPRPGGGGGSYEIIDAEDVRPPRP